MTHLKSYQFTGPIYLLVLWLLVGCGGDYSSASFAKVESERTKLIDGIESYQSIEEFKGYLTSRPWQWEVSKGRQSSPKGRPPFNIVTITIKNYSHLGFSGDLIVTFFNDRLMATTFYPSNVEKYIQILRKAEGITFDNNHEAELPPQTRVRFATDHKGREYVDWSDIRLDKEVELWIKKYS
jgi:hypothetical protein